MVTLETLAAADRVAQHGARSAMLAARSVTADDTARGEPQADGADAADAGLKPPPGPQDDRVRNTTAS